MNRKELDLHASKLGDKVWDLSSEIREFAERVRSTPKEIADELGYQSGDDIANEIRQFAQDLEDPSGGLSAIFKTEDEM